MNLPNDEIDNGSDDDLVAYVDGELDDLQNQKIDEQLVRDQLSRSRVQSLKKTYDLLDYLPKSAPSPDFATKTLTQALPATSHASTVVAVPSLPAKPSLWPWLIASVIALACGVSFGMVARPKPVEQEAITAELLPVIGRLPFYLGVDDLDYLKKLDQPDLFGDESQSIVRLDRPLTNELQSQLFEQFRKLPSPRRKQIVELDHQLRELPQPDRDRMSRVLEEYTIWLDRLPDPIRKEVLDASNSSERMRAVELALSKERYESLPVEKKQRLKVTPDLNERAALSKQWLDEENDRRKEWLLASRQWQAIKEGKRPWPFDDEALRAEIEQYVETILKTDSSTTRLTTSELAKLEILRRHRERDFGWFMYGTFLLEMSKQHSSLPMGKDGTPITQPSQLPESIRKEFTKTGLQQRLKNATGRWPDFALVVDGEHRSKKFGELPNLGPAKSSDFQPVQETFFKDQLLPKLNPKQVNELKNLEGRWPEYPRKVLELCIVYDLSMPGVMLPGKPSLWNQYYRYTSVKMDKSSMP